MMIDEHLDPGVQALSIFETMSSREIKKGRKF